MTAAGTPASGQVFFGMHISLQVDGEANKMLVKFIAAELGVSKSCCSLVQGDTSRRKVVRVNGLGAAEIKRRLCPDVELSEN